MESIDLQMIFSAFSLVVTVYFWFVKARKDRPNLQFHQLSNFHTSCRRHQERDGMKRLAIQQLDTGGVLVVNHSTRQNSIAIFRCYLETADGFLIEGDWGYVGDDKPPWNIGPESSIALSPACFFDVDQDFDVPENPKFRIDFITASGRSFTHQFFKTAPRHLTHQTALSKAA